MSRPLIVVLAIVLLFVLNAYRMLDRSATETLKRLGVPESLAKDCVWYSFSGRYLSHPNTKEIKAVPSVERASIVNQIGAFAKAYTKSEEFKERYLAYRESHKPSPPEKPKTAAQLKSEQKESLKKSIAETEEGIKAMPAEHQPMMNDVVKMLKEQLKSLDDPNNQMFPPDMDALSEQMYAQQLEQHKLDLREWEAKHPITPDGMIVRWLTEFLEVSKDIDFGAKLTQEQGRQIFVNTSYENKSANWKMCYRAGKETVEAARALAKAWLDELGVR